MRLVQKEPGLSIIGVIDIRSLPKSVDMLVKN